jgi:hypothetical protein
MFFSASNGTSKQGSLGSTWSKPTCFSWILEANLLLTETIVKQSVLGFDFNDTLIILIYTCMIDCANVQSWLCDVQRSKDCSALL